MGYWADSDILLEKYKNGLIVIAVAVSLINKQLYTISVTATIFNRYE